MKLLPQQAIKTFENNWPIIHAAIGNLRFSNTNKNKTFKKRPNRITLPLVILEVQMKIKTERRRPNGIDIMYDICDGDNDEHLITVCF